MTLQLTAAQVVPARSNPWAARGAGGIFGRAGWLCLALLAILSAPLCAQDSDAPIVAEIDRLIRRGWEENGITPSPRAPDGEFARRVSLDIVGHIPDLETLTRFLADERPDKRQLLVNQLLDDADYVKNWSNLWANLLVGRGNNRISRPALEKWLREAIYKNTAYDRMVFDLIAAEGDSTSNGAVNFLAAHLNEGAVPATAITARVFLGMQVQCTQCHNHPFNDWKQSQFWGMNAFFRGTRREAGDNRGDFSLTDAPAGAIVFFERRNGLQEAIGRQFIDGTSLFGEGDGEDKPRQQLATLVTDPARPFLAQTQVNRMWGHFFGYGFTRPVDDMGPHNPPSHPELVEFLGREFVRSGYDVKRLVRWITASEAYNLTSSAHEGNASDDPASGIAPLFSRMYLKSFTAEQLYDSLIVATDAHQANRNSEQAENQRRTWLNQFIRTFGTDENDEQTSFNGTIPQALVLMNGELIRNATSDAKGGFLRRLLDESPQRGNERSKTVARATKTARSEPAAKTGTAKKGAAAGRSVRASPVLQQKIDAIFLATLCRTPTDAEMLRINDVFQASGTRDPIIGLQDLFWAILNSNEFIINH